MKTKETKRTEAAYREKEYTSLTIKEKLKMLDTRLGSGVGAEKQRAKLEKLLFEEAVVEKIEETRRKKKQEKAKPSDKNKHGGK